MLDVFAEVLWQRAACSAKTNATRLGARYPLGLTLPDGFSLRLRDVCEYLQNEVSNETPQKVATLARVEQRHVEHAYSCLLIPCNQTPLILYLGIVTSKPIKR